MDKHNELSGITKNPTLDVFNLDFCKQLDELAEADAFVCDRVKKALNELKLAGGIDYNGHYRNAYDYYSEALCYHLLKQKGIEYDRTQWRKYSCSARAHNVARVDGKDQNRNAIRTLPGIAEGLEPLQNGLVSKMKYDSATGEYIEGYGEDLDKTVTHRRTLKFVKDKYWLVTDEFIPSDNNPHQYDIWFHFNTDKYGEDRQNNLVYSSSNTDANVAIIRLSERTDVTVITGQQQPEVQGWVSYKTDSGYYSCRPVATPTYHAEGVGVLKESFVFLPFRKGETVDVEKVKKITSRKYRVYLDKKNFITITL